LDVVIEMERKYNGRLEGRTAIVTGSTYGIGEAIAKVLSSEGAISIITERTDEEGERVAEESCGQGGKGRFLSQLRPESHPGR